MWDSLHYECLGLIWNKWGRLYCHLCLSHWKQVSCSRLLKFLFSVRKSNSTLSAITKLTYRNWLQWIQSLFVELLLYVRRSCSLRDKGIQCQRTSFDTRLQVEKVRQGTREESEMCLDQIIINATKKHQARKRRLERMVDILSLKLKVGLFEELTFDLRRGEGAGKQEEKRFPSWADTEGPEAGIRGKSEWQGESGRERGREVCADAAHTSLARSVLERNRFGLTQCRKKPVKHNKPAHFSSGAFLSNPVYLPSLRILRGHSHPQVSKKNKFCYLQIRDATEAWYQRQSELNL